MTKNIYVFEGGGSKPKPLAVIDMSKYSENDSKAISAILCKKVNNVFTLEVDIPTNCDASQAITNTSDLVLYDTEGNLQEFHVTELADLHEYSVVRTVYAEQSICELIDDIIISSVEMPTTTNPADYLAYILSFTRWSVGTIDSSIYNSKWKEDLTGKNCLEALQMFMNKYNCEFIVRYESDSKNRITGRYIDVKKTIGNNYGKRFEDTKDINALKRNLDLDSIKTAIYPRIAKQSNDDSGNSTVEYVDISTVEWSVAAGDPVNKPLGQTIIIDPNADAMYKRLNSKNGKLQERIMYAEWTEQTAKDAEDLCKQAWRILKANSVINPSYEVTASDLYRLSGNNSDYAHEQVSLGDTCIIIDRKITPELRATTRVVEIEEDLLNPINNKYVFGKYRETLATSNVDQQKSIEEKLAELSGRIQGMTIPEVKPQYQSGKVYYEDIKQDIQNEFMSASGYVMAEDSNGFWVMDAPQGGTPTKALILKGGNLAIATYNTVASVWEVGTFINGTSVNADYINTGHIAADVIATHSITTEHLTASAIQYIRTGMATDEDLQGVIDSVTAIQSDYVTSQELTNAIDKVTGGTLTVSQIKAIEDTQRQLKAEYQSLYSQASKVSASEYLPNGSAAKNDLAAKISAYTSAYNTYNNQITAMIADGNISDEEYKTYKSNADAYATALKNLTDAIEVANDARLANVYAQARQGMVTTADLEVNNESVIASAKAGMVSTGDMTSAINMATKDMATTTIVNDAITNATQDMATNTSVSNAISSATANMATNSSVTSAINNATKDMATNSSVNTAVNNAVKDKVTNTQMNSAITNATKDMATNSSVNSAINNIKIGGTNLAKQTKLLTSKTGDAKWKVISTGTEGFNELYHDSDSTDWVECQIPLYTEINSLTSQVTVSFEYQESNAGTFLFSFASFSSSGRIKEIDNIEVSSNFTLLGTRSGWKYVSYTFDPTSVNGQTGATHYGLQFKKPSGKTGTIHVRKIKIEIGNKATDWTPAPQDVTNDSKMASKIESIRQSYNAITTEYKNNLQQATTLYSNSYLSGTAKTNLNNAKSDYTTKYNAVTSAYNNVVADANLTDAEVTAWNNAIKNLQSATTTLAQRVQEASTYINTAVTNATKDMATNSSVNTAVNNAVKDKVTNTQMNSAISNATKDMATNSSVNSAINNATKDMATNAGVTNAINGVVVGSRNLALLTSDDWVSFSNFKGDVNDCRLNYTVLTKGLSVGDKMLVAFDYKLENMTYSSGQSPTIRIQGSGNVTEWNSGQFHSVNINLSSKPANASGTAYTIANAHSDQLKNSYWNCNFRTDYITGGTVSIKGIRVMRSSKLVSWVAAPEDAYTSTVFETFKAITAEYNSNYKIATTLYSNSYLSGTAKTNLKTAYDDYATKYNAVKSAHDAISSNKYADEGRKTAWNTALTNLQSSTTTLAQRVQEASTYINTAVYNSSKSYTDKAIPDALTGYAKTSYVDSAKAAAIADAKKGMVSTSQLEVNNTEILMKTASMGQYNILRNTDFRDGMNYWVTWGTDGSEPIRVIRETDTSFTATMSGERNMGIISTGTATTGGKNVGFYQDTKKCVVGVSYTVGYWINCTNCSCNVQIESLDSSDTKSVLANKSYTNINGGHDRATWKYDSITFTVPNGSATIRFVGSLTNATNVIHRVLMVKPMMTTGINAQAWTAHPDEIHVGVVSVTEKEGIKVEHSDFDTYTTLNAAGLKIRSTNDDSLVASFGENKSAYIGTLTCDGYVKAPQLMPVANYKKTVHTYYCSETGSGDFSGKGSSNQAIGWGGVMRAILSDLDIDFTHEKGSFIIPNDFTVPITIYIKGTEFSSNIVLGNIFGGGNSGIDLRISDGCKFTGRILLSDIDPAVRIFGNNSTMYRGSSKDAPISLKNVKYCDIQQLKVNYSSQQDYTFAVEMYDSNCVMTYVDMCNCYSAADMHRSHLFMNGCSGNLNKYVTDGQLSYLNVYGRVPAHTSSNPYGLYCINTTPSNRNLTPTGTIQSGGSSATMPVTKTVNIATYASVLDYYRYGCLIQGTPNGSEKSYVGKMTVSKVNEILATMNNDVVIQVFLEREGTSNADTDYVDVVIDGTRVGSLRSASSGWFNLPSSTVNSLKKKESVIINLNATGRSNYTQYRLNAMLKITGTQTV